MTFEDQSAFRGAYTEDDFQTRIERTMNRAKELREESAYVMQLVRNTRAQTFQRLSRPSPSRSPQ